MKYQKGRFTVFKNDPPNDPPPKKKGRFTVFQTADTPVSRTPAPPPRRPVTPLKPDRQRGSPKGPLPNAKTNRARRKSPVRQDRFETLICQLKTLVDKYYHDIRCN
jgi:hypothetical protein